MTQAQKIQSREAVKGLRYVGGLESAAYHLNIASDLRRKLTEASPIMVKMYGEHWRKLARRAVKSARYWRVEVYYPNPQRIPA